MKIRLLLFAIAMLVLLFEEFYAQRDAAEDQLTDPLIVTGCRSAGVVAREIANPGMRYRRYAIGHLGNRRCRAAEPALVKIVENPRE